LARRSRPPRPPDRARGGDRRRVGGRLVTVVAGSGDPGPAHPSL